MDEMHAALNKFLCLDAQPPIPEPLSDSTQLKHFAIEAEMNGNITLAARYHEEVCISSLQIDINIKDH